MITLVYGGSGSGKSAFAEDLVCKTNYPNRYYLATMQSFDEESDKRIKRHRSLRDGKGFTTIECPVDIANAIIDKDSIVLLECMSNLVANEMFREESPKTFTECADKILDDVKALSKKADSLVIVTNNIFEDGLSFNESTKEYMRALGLINETLAKISNEVYEVVVGIGIKL